MRLSVILFTNFSHAYTNTAKIFNLNFDTRCTSNYNKEESALIAARNEPKKKYYSENVCFQQLNNFEVNVQIRAPAGDQRDYVLQHG